MRLEEELRDGSGSTSPRLVFFPSDKRSSCQGSVLRELADGAILELRDRARIFAGAQPQHFVFPTCEYGHVDPTRPQKSWRSAWRKLTNAIECPACGKLQQPAKTCCTEECKDNIEKIKSPTAGLRFHDLRHHAITELAESQASDQTIMAIAGHVAPRNAVPLLACAAGSQAQRIGRAVLLRYRPNFYAGCSPRSAA